MTRPQLPEPVAPVDWFRRCPQGGTTNQQPSTEDTVTDLTDDETRVVMAALDVIEPHLMLTSDHGQVAKDVVATVLREAHRRRGWVHGDPEPIDAGQIIDCQGDRWARDDLGLWVYSEAPLTSTWAELLDSFGPLVEVTR